MKRKQFIKCWTDYPFVELGDAPGQRAPIRHVVVVHYDGNKYAKIRFDDNGLCLEVKAGYLYRKKARLGQAKKVNLRKLNRMLPSLEKFD
jgi:hypothetical protein